MNSEKRRVLIVDDEPDMCWVLETILNKKGLIVEKVSSGQEALALIKSDSFDFAFLDAKLPDMDGLDLSRQILRVVPAMPIVLVSGFFYPDDPNIQQALQKGLILDFIGKPFLNEKILQCIEKARIFPSPNES